MTVPPRLHVIPATGCDKALVLRRGPSGQVASLLWDRRDGSLSLGHWLKGRIYEHRCDLSPDGRHMIVFAGKGGRYWTAISRAPWLTALHIEPQGSTWFGGGAFTRQGRVFFNGAQAPDGLPDRLRPAPATAYPHGTEGFHEGDVATDWEWAEPREDGLQVARAGGLWFVPLGPDGPGPMRLIHDLSPAVRAPRPTDADMSFMRPEAAAILRRGGNRSRLVIALWIAARPGADRAGFRLGSGGRRRGRDDPRDPPRAVPGLGRGAGRRAGGRAAHPLHGPDPWWCGRRRRAAQLSLRRMEDGRAAWVLVEGDTLLVIPTRRAGPRRCSMRSRRCPACRRRRSSPRATCRSRARPGCGRATGYLDADRALTP
jgi:hypothetical protein